MRLLFRAKVSGEAVPWIPPTHLCQSLLTAGSAASPAVGPRHGAPGHAFSNYLVAAFRSTTSPDIAIMVGKRQRERGNIPVQREWVRGLFLILPLTLVLNKSLCLLPYPSPTLDAGELSRPETVCPQQLWLELLGSTFTLINNSLFRALNWQRRRRWKQWPQSSQWLSQSCFGTPRRTPFWGTTQASHLIFRDDSSPRATEGKKRAFCSFYYWFNIYFNLNRNDPKPGGRFLWKYPFFAKHKGTVLAHRVLHRIAGLNFPNENILFFPPRRTAPKLILCCNYICKLSELGLQTVPAERGGKNHICKLRIVPYGFFPVSFFFFFSFFGFHYQIQSYFSLLQYFTINCN